MALVGGSKKQKQKQTEAASWTRDSDRDSQMARDKTTLSCWRCSNSCADPDRDSGLNETPKPTGVVVVEAASIDSSSAYSNRARQGPE